MGLIVVAVIVSRMIYLGFERLAMLVRVVFEVIWVPSSLLVGTFEFSPSSTIGMRVI